jgi:hypothetical protein
MENINGKETLGSHRRKLEDIIESDLNEAFLEAVGWIHLGSG